MIQKTYTVHNDEEYAAMLKDIRSLPEYESAKGRFLMLAIADWHMPVIRETVARADADLKDIKIVAFNNANNEAYNDHSKHPCEYSFFLFDGDCVEVFKHRIG
ncbi:MAG: hypothetical protein IJU93_10275, partial [Lachnospiraceae bacterium]|nr:hypothetical protein [Lachnospiraceae bacterium]